MPTLSMAKLDSQVDVHFANTKLIAGVSTPRTEAAALIAALDVPPAERTTFHCELIQRATRHVKYFVALNDPALHLALCRQLTYERVPEIGQNVFRQGQLGTTFYIILSGSCRVLKSFSKAQHQTSSEGLRVSEDNDLQAGDSFGELALIDSGDGRRAATVEASSPDTELLRLEKKAYVECLAGRKEAELEERVTFLGTTYLFQDWTSDERRAIARVMQRRTVKMNTTIIRQGGTSDVVYLIISGRCRVIKRVELAGDLEMQLAASFPAQRHDNGVRKLGVQSRARGPPSSPQQAHQQLKPQFQQQKQFQQQLQQHASSRANSQAEPVLLELCELREGQHFGELALLDEVQKRAKKGKGTHTASVVSGEENDVTLLEVNRHDLLRSPASQRDEGGIVEAMAAYAERYYPDFAGGDEALAVQIRQQSQWDELKREAKAEAKSTTSKPNEVLRKLPAHISMAGNK